MADTKGHRTSQKKPRRTDHCLQCGASMESKRSDAECCSSRCRSKYNRIRSGRQGPPTTPSRNAEESLRRGRALSPPRLSPFRVLARSCTSCGELLSTHPDEIRKSAVAVVQGCRRCAVKKQTKYKHKRLESGDAEYKKSLRGHADKVRQRIQNKTLDVAVNNKKEWTGPELEIASRPDLSAAEVALMLGRTLYAVKHARRALRIEPKKIRLAGVPSQREVMPRRPQ